MKSFSRECCIAFVPTPIKVDEEQFVTVNNKIGRTKVPMDVALRMELADDIVNVLQPIFSIVT